MVMQLGPPGDLVRVRWIDEDQRRVTLELRTGQTDLFLLFLARGLYVEPDRSTLRWTTHSWPEGL
jgi:hypothetical protein